MKKQILTSAVVAFTLTAYAQNNQADIKQNGNIHEHTVQQTGANEKLTLIQGTPDIFSEGSTAEVVMEGLSNEVYIRQVGGFHYTEIDAAGESNNIHINQELFGHVATVEIIDNASPSNNSVKIDQKGIGQNGSVSIQGGSHHDFQITQAGQANVASMRQYYSSSNTFTIDQDGEENEAYIQQESFRDGDQAAITQLGNDNIARINLADADGISPTRDNQATIKQTGNGNDATIEQKTPDDILYTPDAPAEIALNEATITQHGDDNTALLVQYGSENIGKIQQNGTLNDATLTQAGIGDMATIVQNGSGNTSVVSQGIALP